MYCEDSSHDTLAVYITKMQHLGQARIQNTHKVYCHRIDTASNKVQNVLYLPEHKMTSLLNFFTEIPI